MRVLVVEDEEQMADAIARGLRLHAMAVDVAYDGQEALERASYVDYDVIVLDRDLPEVHGDEVCASLNGSTRVLMLTAAGQVRDRVQGLGLGADDYLAKPFVFAELVARVRTLGRRTVRDVPVLIERCGIVLDPARRTVMRGTREVVLNRKEFDLLRVLMEASGTLVSSADLRRRVWDEFAVESGVLRVTMTSLRRKLGAPAVIENEPGKGYRL
ncbi:MAG: response regulator transcription factor [Thermoactinospora sp.]|nr:response regulator transcription factor [Thermoactinospora sp.]